MGKWESHWMYVIPHRPITHEKLIYYYFIVDLITNAIIPRLKYIIFNHNSATYFCIHVHQRHQTALEYLRIDS